MTDTGQQLDSRFAWATCPAWATYQIFRKLRSPNSHLWPTFNTSNKKSEHQHFKLGPSNLSLFFIKAKFEIAMIFAKMPSNWLDPHPLEAHPFIIAIVTG